MEIEADHPCRGADLLVLRTRTKNRRHVKPPTILASGMAPCCQLRKERPHFPGEDMLDAAH